MVHKCIDAHHHLWRYVPSDQPWMTDEMKILQRDFLPQDLHVMQAAGVTGSVVVESTRTFTETLWLAETTANEDLIRGVVAWVPIVDPNLDTYLEKLAQWTKVKGVRHSIHDEPDDQFILNAEFGRGISRLPEYGLTYDLLIFEKHLPQAIQFVDRHPNQTFVVDHLAKPRIREQSLSPWKDQLTELAQRSNVYCKLSGMVTEANWHTWTRDDLQPYLDVVLEAFGPMRLMFGSDWPVMTLASTYDRWLTTVCEAIGGLSPSEQEWILFRTAEEAYQLD
jgi:L-fuconolactonase